MHIIYENFLKNTIYLKDSKNIAIGLSGGADSKALILCAKYWSAANNCNVTALIVDHKMRSESSFEAQTTAVWCDQKNIKREILVWEDIEKKTSMHYAREARFDLFSNWYRKNKCDALILAHTADDQMENFILSFLRGSGLKGLQGMKIVQQIYDMTIIRPFLETRRIDIENYLIENSENWIEDPSNKNLKYQRVRIREFLKYELALTPRKLWKTVENMQDDYRIIEEIINALCAKFCFQDSYWVVEREIFLSNEKSIATRALEKILQRIVGKHSFRYSSLEIIYNNILISKTSTLAGCIIRSTPKKIKIKTLQ